MVSSLQPTHAPSESASQPIAHVDRFAEAAAAITHTCRLIAQLRGPGGCAWDAEQTLQSLVPFMLEEAAEAAAAGRASDAPALCDELGDVLLQVLLQCEIAQEGKQFNLAQVAQGLGNKLVHRHPHVFGEAQAKDAAEAEALWEAQKASEAGNVRPTSAQAGAHKSKLDGVPTSLPALQRCQKISRKAAKAGFDWSCVQGPLAKVDEELAEVKEALKLLEAARKGSDEALQQRAHRHVADELGDALFSLVNVARHLDVSAEETLHRTIERFSGRFRQVEAGLAARGLQASSTNLDLMGELWQQAKLNPGFC